MALPFGQSTDNFSRLVNSTTAKFFKQQEKNILLRRRLSAALQAKGRVMRNQFGDELKWPVRYKRTAPTVIGDVVNLNFPRQNKDKVARLPWAGYAVTDAIGEKEKLLNKGPAAILRQTALIMERLKEDLADQFGLELYKDGNAAANVGRIMGYESALASTGVISTKWGLPDDTYAGHSTAPGVVGSWNGTWPDGNGDAHYDWWSPIVILGKAAGWTTTSTWAVACLEQLRHGILAMERTTVSTDMVLLTRLAYSEYIQKIESKEYIYTQRSADNSLMVKLGFGNVSNFEGTDITWEEGVGDNTDYVNGYGFSFDKMQLLTPQDMLFKPAPIDFSIENLTDRYLVRFWGQLKLNPRNMLKFKNYAT